MEQNDLHQLIEQQAAEQKKTLYAKYGEEAKRCVEENAKARQRRKRMAIHISALAASFLVVAICLTVILTVVSNSDDIIRYSDGEIKTRQTATTLKEYGEKQTDKILYLDWYNTVAVFETLEGYDSNDTVIYIRERFSITTERSVTLVVMNNIYEVNSFERYNSLNESFELSNGVTLTYSIKDNNIEAKFEYEGYKYFLSFCGTTDAEYVKTTVESMFD